MVFAGDTRQQQPVEAGPGLRLIRDVSGSVRVDRIRRQKADLEDVLVHVHKETPEQARFRAGLTNPQERDAILADYEAMEKRPRFTPWQVAVSEALRDGEAEKAIEAWHLRNRLHLCHDEEKTLNRLVDDWERHVRTQPGTSTVVLARTKAEGRALSWLMRERVLAQTPDAKRAVIEVSRDLDGRVTEPLEIAVGDRIRIGATQWEKQLFNGTVVTVEDLEVRRGDDTAVSRKARNRQAAGRKDGKASESGSSRDESPVHITARTDDGRRVTFRHDEIRDWHDNIRLDYGYAMTIASAQGLTVDRAFLLVDDRPARETIYPAATRHREALDIYVNRSPLAFDIAEHRPEDQADMPVLDSDVRAYLAERWSRSQPKEAALDYVSDGAWRDAREEARHGRVPGEGRQETAEDREASNDNALVRIAQEIRHAVNGWRQGVAVDAFAAERQEVMAAWDELRARARDEGDAMALSPAFRETLDRHGALMRQAASFRARPQVFERLLAERAGIAQAELQELHDVHARAGSYLRSVSARATSAARQAAQPEEAKTDTIMVDAPAYTPEPPVDEHARVQPSETAAPDRRHDTEPAWEALYDRLERDWNDLVAVANRAKLPLPPRSRIRRSDRTRAGPRRTSAAPLDRAAGTDRAARLPPQRDSRAQSRSRLPRGGGASCKSMRAPPARSREPGCTRCRGRRLAGVEPRSPASGRGRQGYPCGRGHLQRLSRRRRRRQSARPLDRRPVAQPHRGRPRPGWQVRETRAPPRSGAQAAGRHRLYLGRPRKAQGAAGATQEARAHDR